MGKSDPIVFDFYSRNLNLNNSYNEVGFFGQVSENNFTRKIKSKSRNFYDIQLGNWNINSFPYEIDKKFDLIVCTRCAYFSKNPEKTINLFLKMLTSDGVLFIDWGIGDHWRFEDYKVGWVKNGEQEYAYEKANYLWSSVWHKKFYNHPALIDFSNNILKFNYTDVYNAITDEIPNVLNLNTLTESKINIEYDMLSLWPEKPQLYILLKMRNI